MSAVPQAVPALVIRVLVHVTDPVRREVLRQLVIDAGHLPVDSPMDADAVLSDQVHAGFAAMPEHSGQGLFTPRELEVLGAIGDGLTNKMIARRLEISPHTVKFHVESLLRKLGARTRAEAVAKAREHRLSNTVEL
ncbi:MAG TPA: response regulator transcription factor [Burkholderiales bacterium]|jgi:DNA-binding CsgD family transcriptional regulator|nr:response regulator transcription factor [Burkholderiales bacterium]